MDTEAPKDFFISYTHADQRWAEWIAWHLETEGYTTMLQAWDFVAGSHFVHEMDTRYQAGHAHHCHSFPRLFLVSIYVF